MQLVMHLSVESIEDSWKAQSKDNSLGVLIKHLIHVIHMFIVKSPPLLAEYLLLLQD
jgi:hypothetical protein